MPGLAINDAPNAGTLTGGEVVPLLKDGSPANTTTNALALYTSSLIEIVSTPIPTPAVLERFPGSTDEADSKIPSDINGLVYVHTIAADSNDWIRLPILVQGKMIRGWSAVAHQLRTASSSGDRINNVVADSVADAPIPAQTYWVADAVEAGLWVVRGWNMQGIATAPIIPNFPSVGSDFEFLLESGDKLLLEDGGVLLLETA
jgi:hypothetical protein